MASKELKQKIEAHYKRLLADGPPLDQKLCEALVAEFSDELKAMATRYKRRLEDDLIHEGKLGILKALRLLIKNKGRTAKGAFPNDVTAYLKTAADRHMREFNKHEDDYGPQTTEKAEKKVTISIFPVGIQMCSKCNENTSDYYPQAKRGKYAVLCRDCWEKKVYRETHREKGKRRRARVHKEWSNADEAFTRIIVDPCDKPIDDALRNSIGTLSTLDRALEKVSDTDRMQRAIDALFLGENKRQAANVAGLSRPALDRRLARMRETIQAEDARPSVKIEISEELPDISPVLAV